MTIHRQMHINTAERTQFLQMSATQPARTNPRQGQKLFSRLPGRFSAAGRRTQISQKPDRFPVLFCVESHLLLLSVMCVILSSEQSSGGM